MASTVTCSLCGSKAIIFYDLARKAGSVVGIIAGAIGGLANALIGYRTNVSPSLARLAGAALGALIGAAAGCKTGAALGGTIDDNMLHNCQCVSCGHTFSKQRSGSYSSKLRRYS